MRRAGREANDGAELAAAHTAGKLFAGHLDHDAVDAARRTSESRSTTRSITSRSRSATLLHRGGAAWPTRSRRQCGLDSRQANPAHPRGAQGARRQGHLPPSVSSPRDVKLMYGAHVTADAGTGLVHTAPGHGYEDFVVGKQYGLKPLTPVDGSGIFTRRRRVGGAERLQGERPDRRESADDRRAAARREARAQLSALLAMPQSADFSRHRAMVPAASTITGCAKALIAEIDSVNWYPAWSRDRIRNMTETRPDWCHLAPARVGRADSRAQMRRLRRRHAADRSTMKRVEEIFAREGSDAWYMPARRRLRRARRQMRQVRRRVFAKDEDILDVWFDSGSSQAAVLAQRPDLSWPADAYLEAVEQARGWFSSSLVCAVSRRAARRRSAASSATA